MKIEQYGKMRSQLPSLASTAKWLRISSVEASDWELRNIIGEIEKSIQRFGEVLDRKKPAGRNPGSL